MLLQSLSYDRLHMGNGHFTQLICMGLFITCALYGLCIGLCAYVSVSLDLHLHWAQLDTINNEPAHGYTVLMEDEIVRPKS